MENKKYDRLTKSLVYPLIEKYYASGELPSRFYNREGLSESPFYTWRQKYLRDHPSVAKKLGVVVRPPRSSRVKSSVRTSTGTSSSSPEEKFVRVDMPPVSPAAEKADSVYELCYPNGLRLRVSSDIAISRLSELIRLC